MHHSRISSCWWTLLWLTSMFPHCNPIARHKARRDPLMHPTCTGSLLWCTPPYYIHSLPVPQPDSEFILISGEIGSTVWWFLPWCTQVYCGSVRQILEISTMLVNLESFYCWCMWVFRERMSQGFMSAWLAGINGTTLCLGLRLKFQSSSLSGEVGRSQFLSVQVLKETPKIRGRVYSYQWTRVAGVADNIENSTPDHFLIFKEFLQLPPPSTH